MKLPENVKTIITTLENAGFEGYAVGGCVRDTLLHKNPDDWDITTNASPIEVKKLFPCTIDTGIAHGTVTVLIGKETFEVTTYRIDGEYEDARHPKEVVFTSCLSEDLKRRDFTMNALMKDIALEQVGAFQDAFLDRMRALHQDVLDKLASGVIDDAAISVIKQTAESVVTTFK